MPNLFSTINRFVVVAEDSPRLNVRCQIYLIFRFLNTFGAIKPSGGISPLLARDLILVPYMKSKSSFLWGSKKAMALFFVS